MGGSSTTLSIVLKLVDDASAAMASVGDKLKSVGESMTSAGRTLTADVTLPIVGIGTAATKMASDFQASMMQLVTQAGLPADQLAKLTAEVQAFADSGAQQTPEVLAQGLYHIVSLGVPAANAMNVLKLASEGAAIGHANLEDVANALGAAVASNIKGSGDYQNAMAVLNATVGAGNMRMQDLATSLGNVLPQATTAGLSLTDVGAAMATMTDNGMPAADAATRLHMAIALMSAPTGQAQKALESINMTQFALADDMRNKGLLPALQDLHDHLVDSGKTADEQAAVLSAAFGGGRSAGAIELLLNNLDRVGQKYQLIDEGVNKFGGDVQAQSQTAAAQFAEAQAQMADASIKLGAALLPLIEDVLPKLVSLVTTIVSVFTSWPKPVQDTILVALGLFAVLGPLLIIIGSIITAIGTLAGAFTLVMPVILAVGAAIGTLSAPILLIIIAVALLAAAVYLNWNSIINWTSNMMLTVANAWNTGWTAMSKFLTSLLDGMKTAVQDAMNFIMGLVNNIMNAINTVKSAAASIGSGIGNAVGGAFNNVVHAFAAGGIVNGPTLALVGEAGPEAIIPLSAFAGGSSLAGGGIGGGGGIVVNITGNTISNQLDVRNLAQTVGAEIVRVLRLNQKLSI
jgi:TP901 family phage tail tape measure protein